MKRILLSALIGVSVMAVISIFSGSNAAPTQQSYPLVCRGGGSLVTGMAPGERNIGFTFIRGTKPTGEGLAPGECSWIDRGMYPNEPDTVSQHVEEGSESLKVGGTLAPENRWYEELHSSDKYWTFMVSNNGRGQLIATSARPNPRMDVSPTARVPSMIGQILRPDLPRARTQDDETPKMITLNGPVDPNSRAKLMKGLTVGRNLNVPQAPRPLSWEAKMGLLKSAGLEAFDEKTAPYVSLTPQQPYVAGRGFLYFYFGSLFPEDNIAGFSDNIHPDCTPLVGVVVNFETKGTYLMTLTVRNSTYATTTAAEFVIEIAEPVVSFTKQKFLDKKSGEWQRLNMFAEVAKPGEYFFILRLEAKGKLSWEFSSCDVTILKK